MDQNDNQDVLTKEEIKALNVHLGIDHYEYLTSDQLMEFIRDVSSSFEKHHRIYNNGIKYARERLLYYYLPLINGLAYDDFKNHYQEMFNKASQQFKTFLNEFNNNKGIML